MGIQSFGGYQVIDDACGITAPPALDEDTAIKNAVQAQFTAYQTPASAPNAGATVWMCPDCLVAAVQANLNAPNPVPLPTVATVTPPPAQDVLVADLVKKKKAYDAKHEETEKTAK
jgi:hypothetical protein